MVDVSKARRLGPKYGPDKTKTAPKTEGGANTPAFLETTLGKNLIKSRTGALAKLRKHIFDTGEGLEYLWAIYQDILLRHPHGMMGLQDWATRYSLGTIPAEIYRELQSREKDIPFAFNSDDLGELLHLLYEERKQIKFWHANPIDKTPEQIAAIKAFETREKDRVRREGERRARGAVSEIERRANAQRKLLKRREQNISRTTEWRRRKAQRQ